MALQKERLKVERKKRVILPTGQYVSGKKVGRPSTNQTESLTINLPPELFKDLKTLATLHYRGNMSAFVRVVLSNALPVLQDISDQANRMADEKRGHFDPGAKKRKPKKPKSEDDLGFEVV